MSDKIYCNIIIHKELSDEYVICPFCYKQISERKMKKSVLECCDKQEIINDNGEIVCRRCGVIQYFDYHKEYIDFYENKYKIRKKSVYIRKYHPNNILINICEQNNIQLRNSDKLKRFEIFDKINKVIPELNHNRKRIISIKYMLKQIFDMLKIDYRNIEITKSDSTLKFYDNYWNDLKKLINL